MAECTLQIVIHVLAPMPFGGGLETFHKEQKQQQQSCHAYMHCEYPKH